MQAITSRRFFYGWIVVGVTALTLIISAGVRSAPGVFLLPMRAELGWSREAISFAVSIGLLLYGLAGPFTGWLMDRFGPRMLMLAGMLLVSLSMAMSAFMREIWQMNAFWGALSGIGTGVASAVLGATVANRWFVQKRGIVTGIFGAATSAGQLIFVPLLVWLAEVIGWRNSVLVLGGTTLAIMLPIALLMRDDPTQIGSRPYGAPEGSALPAASAAAREPGVMSRALRTPAFWLLAATFFVCGATSNGLIGVHFIPYANDCGIGAIVASGTLAVMGAFNFVGTIGSGWLTDRYDPRKLLLCYYGFRGLSLLLLPFLRDPLSLTIFAILFGLDYIATVPPTTMLVADLFGRRNVGTVFGWVFFAHQLGAAAASWIGGFARDAMGDYVLTFLIAGGIAVSAGVLALRINRIPPVAPVAPQVAPAA
ncbi:MAG: MFS transporter [Roseiflexaceae bacterium]